MKKVHNISYLINNNLIKRLTEIPPTTEVVGFLSELSNELFNLMVKEILEKIDEMSRDYNNSAELKDSYIKEISDNIKVIHGLICED